MKNPHKPLPPLTAKDVARFWEKVQIGEPDECWLWTSTTNCKGYGYFWIGTKNTGSRYGAHRISHFLSTGVDAHLLLVRHSCHVRNCVNPSHLSIGTDRQNHADMVEAGRGMHGLYSTFQKLGAALTVLPNGNYSLDLGEL
jgi:hypothetical protein